MLSSGILEAKNKGSKIMPYCPKCFSSDIDDQNSIVRKGIGAGLGILAGVLFTPIVGAAVGAAGMKNAKHKYKCNKCGHEFD